MPRNQRMPKMMYIVHTCNSLQSSSTDSMLGEGLIQTDRKMLPSQICNFSPKAKSVAQFVSTLNVQFVDQNVQSNLSTEKFH